MIPMSCGIPSLSPRYASIDDCSYGWMHVRIYANIYTAQIVDSGVSIQSGLTCGDDGPKPAMPHLFQARLNFCRVTAHVFQPHLGSAVKELKLNYHNSETILFTMDYIPMLW